MIQLLTKTENETNINLETFLQTTKQQLETFLEQILPLEDKNTQENSNLCTAIRYAVLNGGKRLRPALVYATGIALNVDNLASLNVAAASVELIHSYSLIHDDLPAMDNDDFRRGRPSCHKAFNEATAILVGDALQTLAFELLSEPALNTIAAESKIKMINVFAKASGMHGMVLGQGEDLAAENKSISLAQLTQLHQHKTGALIKAAIHLGILAANCTDQTKVKALLHYGDYIGLAFQVYDDILDITADTFTLGKPANSDQHNNKSTFPALMGLEQAKKYALSLQQKAIDMLTIFNKDANCLRNLAIYFVNRKS